jgi:hypothetical protein
LPRRRPQHRQQDRGQSHETVEGPLCSLALNLRSLIGVRRGERFGWLCNPQQHRISAATTVRPKFYSDQQLQPMKKYDCRCCRKFRHMVAVGLLQPPYHSFDQRVGDDNIQQRASCDAGRGVQRTDVHRELLEVETRSLEDHCRAAVTVSGDVGPNGAGTTRAVVLRDDG